LDLNEVAPPGWGHTKAEKEKTKPDKPKSKIGGSAAAFKRALEDGRFKGLPGDKTKKEKTASMFKLMWSMKKKGAKPHYKPGTDKKYEKYQEDWKPEEENQLEESPSILKVRGKRNTYMGPSGDHRRDKEGNIVASHYNKKPAPVGDKNKKTSYRDKPKRDLVAMRARKKARREKREARARERAAAVKEGMTPMKDNNLFGNAYAGSYEKLKKKIGSKKKHNKPAIQEGDFKSFMADAQAARDRVQKKIDDRKKKDAQYVETRSKGVRFYDKKGKGRIKSGKKIYD
jgi:hypothetical protein